MGQEKRTGTELHYFSRQLKSKLDKMRRVPATLVEAPSGYGKTTAVQDFLEAQVSQNTPVYWFTAMEETPAAAFRRLCRAIDGIDSSVGERLLKMELPNAATIGEATDALRSLQCNHEAYLVLDNFQFLQEFLPPAFFVALLEHSGRDLHIIIVTQMLRRNILAAVTGRGFLHITASDLRLSAGDIRSYYALAGVSITPEEALGIERYTEGWIIAVYLQLCSFMETGAVAEAPGLALMEHLVWDHLTEAQQEFLLRLSLFKMVTLRQCCFLMGCDTLPQYALDALQSSFIRHYPAGSRYELHSILADLLNQKRREREAAFRNQCLLQAGDFCRDEGRTVEALGFYAQVEDYERMLSLDLSPLPLETIGEVPFSDLACDIALNCPADIKKKHLLSMLQVAWALLMAGKNHQFDLLMEELHPMLEVESKEESSHLLGEWMLLSSFNAFPRIEEMTGILREAALLFKGRCSQVILPTAPWWFGSHSPLAEFHTQPGEVDREAEAFQEYIALYSRLTNGSGSGADVLFRADLAYHRGNLHDAEILAYKAVFLAESTQQSVIQLGATMLLAEIALHKADTAGWQHAVSSMERAASYPSQNNFIIRSVLDIIRGILLNELQDHTGIAQWLQEGAFSGRGLVPSVIYNAQYVYLSLMMHREEFPRLIGVAQAIVPDDVKRYPFREFLLNLTLAVGYLSMGDRDQAAALVEYAAQRALPDGLIFPMASYSWLLQGLPGALVEEKYPALLDQFNVIKERFSSGWTTLRSDMFPEELPPDLTSREYQVARLAAEGLRNSEIARKLVVSESTVRAHMRTIFQKLDIDRRARLAEKLK